MFTRRICDLRFYRATRSDIDAKGAERHQFPPAASHFSVFLAAGRGKPRENGRARELSRCAPAGVRATQASRCPQRLFVVEAPEPVVDVAIEIRGPGAAVAVVIELRQVVVIDIFIVEAREPSGPGLFALVIAVGVVARRLPVRVSPSTRMRRRQAHRKGTGTNAVGGIGDPRARKAFSVGWP